VFRDLRAGRSVIVVMQRQNKPIGLTADLAYRREIALFVHLLGLGHRFPRAGGFELLAEEAQQPILDADFPAAIELPLLACQRFGKTEASAIRRRAASAASSTR
jgi:hypothetical protein